MIPGKPYLGIAATILTEHDNVHGIPREAFLTLVMSRGEPLLFSSVIPITLGTEALFFEGTRGSVVRLSTREEFLAWEQRLFPGCKTILTPHDRYFVEVKVD